MSYSPVKNIDFSKITTSGPDKGYIDPTMSSPAGEYNSFTTGESDMLSMGLNTASGFVGPKNIEDENFSGKYAQQKALEYGAMGAKYAGPVGAFVGGTFGLGYGLIKGQDIKGDYLMDQQDKLIAGEKKQEQIQKYQMMEEYRNAPTTMTGKPVKALAQMQGTVARNMSAKQHSENQKMNALAMHGIPAALTMIENPSVKQKAAFDHNNDNKVSTEELKTTFKS